MTCFSRGGSGNAANEAKSFTTSSVRRAWYDVSVNRPGKSIALALSSLHKVITLCHTVNIYVIPLSLCDRKNKYRVASRAGTYQARLKFLWTPEILCAHRCCEPTENFSRNFVSGRSKVRSVNVVLAAGRRRSHQENLASSRHWHERRQHLQSLYLRHQSMPDTAFRVTKETVNIFVPVIFQLLYVSFSNGEKGEGKGYREAETK